MKKVRHWLEYTVVRSLMGLVDRLSLPAATRLAVHLADAAYALSVSRRRIARDNILASGIVASRREASAIARRSFRHFAILIVEAAKAAHSAPETRDWRAETAGCFPPDVQAVLDDPARPVIVATGHLGNWEIAASVLASYKPTVAVVRRLNNPLVDRLMEARRAAARNVEFIPKRDARIVRLISALRAGSALALMIDQRAHKRGVMTDFFGRPASTHAGAAILHLLTGAPIFVAVCIRTGPMQIEIRSSSLIAFHPTGDRTADVRALLTRLNMALEEHIRRCPDQYLWFHRRWRPPPVGAQSGRR